MSQNNSENPDSNLTQMSADSPPSDAMSGIQIRAELYAGPLPHPDMVEQYERM